MSGSAGQADSGVSPGRRRLLKGAAIGTPVIMTLASRPVLATNCSISGNMSGNLSHHDEFICDGRTPGYWGEHPNEWQPLGYYAGGCKNGMSGKHCKDHAYEDDGTPFHDMTLGFAGSRHGSLTMMQVIQLGGNDDDYQLGAHAVAALLNAAYFGQNVFGYSEDEIRRIYREKELVDPENLKLFFALLNENRRDLAQSLGLDGFLT